MKQKFTFQNYTIAYDGDVCWTVTEQTPIPALDTKGRPNKHAGELRDSLVGHCGKLPDALIMLAYRVTCDAHHETLKDYIDALADLTENLRDIANQMKGK